jgi:hypothetical protein
MTGTQTAILVSLLAALLGLYVFAIVTVRNLTRPAEELTVSGEGDGTHGCPGEAE